MHWIQTNNTDPIVTQCLLVTHHQNDLRQLHNIAAKSIEWQRSTWGIALETAFNVLCLSRVPSTKTCCGFVRVHGVNYLFYLVRVRRSTFDSWPNTFPCLIDETLNSLSEGIPTDVVSISCLPERTTWSLGDISLANVKGNSGKSLNAHIKHLPITWRQPSD